MSLSDQSDNEAWDPEAEALLATKSSTRCGAGRVFAAGLLVAAALAGVFTFKRATARGSSAGTSARMDAEVGFSLGSCGNFEKPEHLTLLRAQCPVWLRGEVPTAMARAHVGLPSRIKEVQKKKMKFCCESLSKKSTIAARQLLPSGISSIFNMSQMDQMREYGKNLFDRYSADMVPNNNHNDTNKCADDEEMHANLCYKTCAQLTNGTAPVRASAWSCCPTQGCNPVTEMTWDMGVCSGYDVAGDSVSPGGCPHPAGACMTNEEMFMGLCFAKCSDLNSQYPHRVSPVTCCKTQGVTCFFPSNTDTSLDYKKGGGSGDMDSSTPGNMHPPMKSMT
jgi:hypothetical protein